MCQLIPHLTARFERPVAALRRHREARVVRLIGAIVLLGAADLALTVLTMETTGMLEANPIVRGIVAATGSSLGIAAYKAATMLAGLGLIYHLRRHVQAELAAWLVTLVFAGVCVTWVLYHEATADLDLMAFSELAQSQSDWVVIQ